MCPVVVHVGQSGSVAQCYCFVTNFLVTHTAYLWPLGGCLLLCLPPSKNTDMFLTSGIGPTVPSCLQKEMKTK